MSQPTPHSDLPANDVTVLTDLDPETLHLTAVYAEKLADHQSARSDNKDEEERREPPDKWERTDEEWNDAFTGRYEAPASATLTVKTIDDNRYYYWQWSEDGKTKSEYIGPVNPKR